MRAEQEHLKDEFGTHFPSLVHLAQEQDIALLAQNLLHLAERRSIAENLSLLEGKSSIISLTPTPSLEWKSPDFSFTAHNELSTQTRTRRCWIGKLEKFMIGYLFDNNFQSRSEKAMRSVLKTTRRLNKPHKID